VRKLLAFLLIGGLCTLGLGCSKETKKETKTEVKDKAPAKSDKDTNPKDGSGKITPEKGAEIDKDKGKAGMVALMPEKPTVTVKKGQKVDAKIKVERSGGFDGPVNLTVEPEPNSGLVVTGGPAEGDEATVSIDAKNAKPGPHKVKITGSAEKGLKKPAETNLTVEVK